MTPAERADRWIFVAGADGRLGRAVCARLADEASLVLHGRMPRRTETGDQGRQVRVHADLTDPAAVTQLRKQLESLGIGQLAAVLNCTTGFDGRPVPLSQLTAAEFQRVVEVDLIGAFNLVTGLLPLLSGGQGARVVFMSTLAAVRGRPAAAHLCAAKAGLHGLAAALNQELAAAGVTVHVLAPGPIDHPPGTTSVPSAAAADVAELLAVLASPAGDLLRGQVLQLQAR
jgi:3-oxoacyl-[acyl-carrier protein] reductase